MRLFVFGSSITSSFWNGAATYYRGIYRALSELGHSITFAEPDAYGRLQKRDASAAYVTLREYSDKAGVLRLLEEAAEYDLIIKHSGVGVFDELLEREVIKAGKASGASAIFWDVDAPATLQRVEEDPQDGFRQHIPQYDLVLTYGGGAQVVERYQRLGARACRPIYNALDPADHYPASPDAAYRCDLLFVGHRLPDREARVTEFFFRAAELAPRFKFLLGGEGWQGRSLPPNVRWIGHVPTTLHNVVNSSARRVLNINRDSMADVGFSPPTRVFEAAGAGACTITDEWPGIAEFFAPGAEILVARNGEDVVRHLTDVDNEAAHAIGARMRQRALAHHTYRQRAAEVNEILIRLSRPVQAAA